MPVPVIDETTSLLVFARGQFFVYQPAATNVPTSWTADGLPDGVTIDADTGRIDGAAEESGFYNVTLTATNASGSDQFIFAISIWPSDFSLDAFTEVDVDLATKKVRNPGVTDNDAPILFAKCGDYLLLSVGFRKNGWLQQLALGHLTLAVKEYEPELRVVLGTGAFVQIGSYDTARYQIAVHFDPDALRAVLSNHEDDKGTGFDSLAELSWTAQVLLPGDEDPTELPCSSQTFKLRLERDLNDTDNG